MTNSGRFPALVNTTDNGPDGPGGGLLMLAVDAGVGHVNVERGS